MHFLRMLALTAFGFLLCSQTIKATSYTYTFLNIPGGTAEAADINNLGQVVGVYFLDQNGTSFAGRTGFIYDHGAYKLNNPPLPGNDFFGVNDLGQTVGFSADAVSGLQKGFLDSNGVFSSINFPGSSATIPFGINNAGVIVGSYLLPGQPNTNYAFVRSAAGVYTTLIFPGSSSISASGINDLGQIVGGYYDATGYHTFLYSGGQFTTGGGIAINNLGQFLLADGVKDPDGTFNPLSLTGYEISPTGINDAGQVVGQAYIQGGSSYTSFIATPTAVPEPGTLFLTALLVPSLLLMARSGKQR